MPASLFYSQFDKYSVHKSAAITENPDPTGCSNTVHCRQWQRAHKPTAALSSIREYLWSLSVSKHSMVWTLGVDAPNTLLRSWCVNPSELRPMPSCQKMSSKSVKSRVLFRKKDRFVSEGTENKKYPYYLEALVQHSNKFHSKLKKKKAAAVKHTNEHLTSHLFICTKDETYTHQVKVLQGVYCQIFLGLEE